jgi:hypothetical protein
MRQEYRRGREPEAGGRGDELCAPPFGEDYLVAPAALCAQDIDVQAARDELRRVMRSIEVCAVVLCARAPLFVRGCARLIGRSGKASESAVERLRERIARLPSGSERRAVVHAAVRFAIAAAARDATGAGGGRDGAAAAAAPERARAGLSSGGSDVQVCVRARVV